MGARFYCRAFILRWKRVCIAHNNCMKLPIDMGNSISCSLIYFWVPFQLFLHDQPLSEGEIISRSVSASRGEAALSTPEAVVASRAD